MKWEPVQWFDDQDAALQFVLQCQPFDYQPDGVDWPIQVGMRVFVKDLSSEIGRQLNGRGGEVKEFLPATGKYQVLIDGEEEIKEAKEKKNKNEEEKKEEKKELKSLRLENLSPEVKSREEAFTLAKQMDPIPDEFVATAADFHRRLRVRHVPQEQVKVRKGLKIKQQARTKPQKPWCVEQSGDLFERVGENFRSLKEIGSKFYIAVDGNEVFEKVLAEGFRVTKRTSIPCSSTPQDAMAAIKRHSDNVTSRVVVLTVIDLPLGQDGKPVNVIARRSPQWKPKKDRTSMNDARPTPAEQEQYGYLIQTNYIPANCFSKRKIGGADTN